MVAKGKLMKGRARRLDEMSLFVNRQSETIDYSDVANVFKISPYQARLDLTYLVRKKKVPLQKVYGYEDGENFMGEIIFRHNKKRK